MEKKRIEWIDSIKGFAIICVVLGHIVKGYMDAGLYPENTSLMHAVYNIIYAFHMPLFFTISGFLFNEAYVVGTLPDSSIKTRSVNRQMINLLILYVGYNLLLGSSKIIFSGAVTNKVNMTDLIMIWAKPIQLFWYLYVLLLYYMLFRVDRIRNTNQYCLLVVLAIISALTGFIPAIEWFQINNFLYYAFFFALGIGFKYLIQHITFVRGGYCLCIMSVILSICLWSHNRYLCTIPIANWIIASGLVFGLIELFRKTTIISSNPLFLLCGKYNLEIFLLHSFSATASRAILSKTGINANLSIMCNLVISIVVPVLFSIVAKKIGAYNLFFKPYRLIEIIAKKK